MTTQAIFLGAASATAGALVAATTLTFFAPQPDVTAEQLAEIHSRLDGVLGEAAEKFIDVLFFHGS